MLNGEAKDVADGCSLSGLLALLNLKPERLAIELNLKIVRRANWDSTTVAEGDRVEIVHFVGGGA